MKLFAASALTLCLSFAIGCAEGTAPASDTTLATIANATNKVEANITGMDCTGCSGSVEAAIAKIEGVEAAHADVASGDVQVALKEGVDTEAKKAEIETVLAALSDGKYTVNTIAVSIKDDHGDDHPHSEDEAEHQGDAKEAEPADEQASAEDTVFVLASYKVKGMDCSGCSSQIVNAVEQVDGVQKVEANHMTGAVKVSFEDRFDDKVKTDEIKDVIGGLSNGKYTVSY